MQIRVGSAGTKRLADSALGPPSVRSARRSVCRQFVSWKMNRTQLIEGVGRISLYEEKNQARRVCAEPKREERSRRGQPL